MADLFGEEEDQQEMEEDEEEVEEEEEDILDMGDDDGVQQQDVLLMRFCPHDSSMLYPKVCCHRNGSLCLIFSNIISNTIPHGVSRRKTNETNLCYMHVDCVGIPNHHPINL